MKNKKILFLIVILVVLAVLIFWIVRTQTTISTRDLSQTEEEMKAPGQIGEVLVVDEATGEEAPLVTAEMPRDVFSTTGVIVKVLSNGVVINTDGYSFADGVNREIGVIINEKTVSFSADRKERRVGLEILEWLKAGDQVLISSLENIRGKDKFMAQYINLVDL